MPDDPPDIRESPGAVDRTRENRKSTRSFYLHSGPFEIFWISLLVVMVLFVLALPLLIWLRNLIRQG